MQARSYRQNSGVPHPEKGKYHQFDFRHSRLIAESIVVNQKYKQTLIKTKCRRTESLVTSGETQTVRKVFLRQCDHENYVTLETHFLFAKADMSLDYRLAELSFWITQKINLIFKA